MTHSHPAALSQPSPPAALVTLSGHNGGSGSRSNADSRIGTIAHSNVAEKDANAVASGGSSSDAVTQAVLQWTGSPRTLLHTLLSTPEGARLGIVPRGSSGSSSSSSGSDSNNSSSGSDSNSSGRSGISSGNSNSSGSDGSSSGSSSGSSGSSGRSDGSSGSDSSSRSGSSSSVNACGNSDNDASGGATQAPPVQENSSSSSRFEQWAHAAMAEVDAAAGENGGGMGGRKARKLVVLLHGLESSSSQPLTKRIAAGGNALICSRFIE